MPPTQIDQYRHEIEARTSAGESCEQVAAALRASGFEVSAKTISRWRVTWDLRKRNAGTVGRKYPDRKRKDPGTNHESKLGKMKAQEHRKAEITERTRRGETAEQIATALQQQGFVLKSGASAIYRLQTTWGLIPFDEDRARGRGKYKKQSQARVLGAASIGPEELRQKNRAKTASTKRRPQKLAPANPSETLHYPAGCANGPNARSFQTQLPQGLEPAVNVDSDSEPEPLPTGITDEIPSAPPVNRAAELMSAELLVDLATSTLAAANRVKELYIAQQMQRPASGTTSGRPPTEEDIITAKRKVREAAAVMHDLALPTE